MVPEMIIESKDRIDAEMVYQGKTGAVGIAQFSVLKFSEKDLRSFGNISRNREDGYCCGLKLRHELNGGLMTASHLEQRVSFVEDIVRGVKKGFFLVELFVMRFCGVVVLVVGNGKRTESAGINKNLQLCSPYRNLS